MIIPIKSRYINLSEEEFVLFCQEMADFRVERASDGTILIMEPAFPYTGRFNVEVSTEVSLWNRREGKGIVFDSSTGFTLPNSSVRSPDTSWIAIEKWNTVSLEDRNRFTHISPDFIIEIRSKTDRLNTLKAKMLEYQENGVRLGWLIDPVAQEIWIYRVDGSIDHVPSFDVPLSGEDVLEGFELRLNEL